MEVGTCSGQYHAIQYKYEGKYNGQLFTCISLHYILSSLYTFYIHVPVSTDIPDAQLSTMDLMLGEGREEKKLQNSQKSTISSLFLSTSKSTAFTSLSVALGGTGGEGVRGSKRKNGGLQSTPSRCEIGMSSENTEVQVSIVKCSGRFGYSIAYYSGLQITLLHINVSAHFVLHEGTIQSLLDMKGSLTFILTFALLCCQSILAFG